jgi:hypothetical protein
MKKTILAFGILATTLVACETKENADDTKDKTVKTVEISKDSYLDFNDAIVMEISNVQAILTTLKELDAQDISEEEMVLAAAAAKEQAKVVKTNLQNIPPTGKGSEAYLAAAIDVVEATINVTQVYHDFASTLSIIEDEWSEQQIMEWMNMAEPPFMDYQDAFTLLGLMQQNYAAFQNLEIESLVEEVPEEDEVMEEPVLENI